MLLSNSTSPPLLLQRRQLLLALLLTTLCQGYPGGVGGCAGGRAAVEGLHLTTPARETGSLADAGLEVVLGGNGNDGFVLKSGNWWNNFAVGVDHTLTLRCSSTGEEFRGFLFRLGPPGDNDAVDTTRSLRPTNTDAIVPMEQCVVEEGVGGLGHTNGNLKERVSGILRMNAVVDNLQLDVTVVLQNRSHLSRFYHTRFLLNAVSGPTGDGGPVVTRSPVVAPAPAPNTPAPVPLMTTIPIPASAIGMAQQKVAPAAKCGSLALDAERGGAAAETKDCQDGGRGNGNTRRRRLKGTAVQS